MLANQINFIIFNRLHFYITILLLIAKRMKQNKVNTKLDFLLKPRLYSTDK